MESMSDAAVLTGRHTNHSILSTMISTLRKENVEAINIIVLAGQRNISSLDCYSSTSTEQQKDMSLKLSIVTSIHVKDVINLFLKAKYLRQELFHSRMKMEEKICSLELFLTTASSPLLLPMLATLLTMPQFQ